MMRGLVRLCVQRIVFHRAAVGVRRHACRLTEGALKMAGIAEAQVLTDLGRGRYGIKQHVLCSLNPATGDIAAEMHPRLAVKQG